MKRSRMTLTLSTQKKLFLFRKYLVMLGLKMGEEVNSTLLGESSAFALECTLWSVSRTQNLQTDVTLNP